MEIYIIYPGAAPEWIAEAEGAEFASLRLLGVSERGAKRFRVPGKIFHSGGRVK